MMHFLDFDRTLFDTEAFFAFLGERFNEPLPETDIERVQLAARLASRVASGGLTLAPGELAPFVYADVPEFLRALGNEAVIVTYGDEALQRMKIESALAGIPRVSAIYVGESRKGPHLARRLAISSTRALFVDDTPLELESVAAHCPEVSLYEMRRDGEVGDGRWPVIRSLYDLP